jgi:hypothetical protein
MIRTTNESPTVWSTDELMARLDQDCYLTVVTNDALVILNDESESVEATLNGDDVQDLIDRHAMRLRHIEGPGCITFIFGICNLHMNEMLDSQSQPRH